MKLLQHDRLRMNSTKKKMMRPMKPKRAGEVELFEEKAYEGKVVVVVMNL